MSQSSWRRSKYTEMVTRLEKLDQKAFIVDEIGTLQDYLIFMVKTPPKKGNKEILLSAGIHGDEPAGIEALLEAMESNLFKKWANNFNFTILPCINPSGYDLGTRENEDKIDLNRSFDKDDVPESSAIKKFLQGKKFELFLELHEDWEYDGYYLYEPAKTLNRLGPTIIEQLSKAGMPIHNGKADGRDTLNGMVVTGPVIPPGIGSKIMALYIKARNAKHVITSETPSKLRMEERVEMNMIVLNTCLRLLGK